MDQVAAVLVGERERGADAQEGLQDKRVRVDASAVERGQEPVGPGGLTHGDSQDAVGEGVDRGEGCYVELSQV